MSSSLARFEVLTAVLLKILLGSYAVLLGVIFSDVSKDCVVSIVTIKQSKNIEATKQSVFLELTMKMKALQPFETSRTKAPKTRLNMP
jgi:hypothetical protein